jgi:hypothetical protein
LNNENYKLDWETAEISLAKGRFVHTLRRPDPEVILGRDKEIEIEIPIAKDGSYSIPDPTETEEIDARCYEKIMVGATGYGDRSIPTQHKAAAFQGLYVREIDVDEDCDIFGDEISVIEEIGRDDDPDFTIVHVIAQPDEAELRKLRKKLNSGRMVPAKRGRHNFVRSSGLRAAMECYSRWLKRIDGATVAGETFSAENRAAFIHHVDPLIQMRVVTSVVEKLTGKLLD